MGLGSSILRIKLGEEVAVINRQPIGIDGTSTEHTSYLDSSLLTFLNIKSISA